MKKHLLSEVSFWSDESRSEDRGFRLKRIWKHIIGGNEAWSENTKHSLTTGIAVYTRSRRRRVLEPDNIPLKTQSFLLKWPFFLVEPLRKR
ncbi:hypothetical protein JHK82_017605 [Glycine max]|uniref:Uncharacterized protein n=1 Tax=Glycine max TaxID=3847 RepID=K7KZR8_SOYBN|nr:hypothetical protein JHK87_017546 [Glycine soja]KAG5021702.1 hypothetical protein JHK85_018044 [Glycine max]KAG5036822.1 hypothetical protein JHK86_017662 [Glycine max]KAG5141910.1 hypothetical protein JHK82_017605 [Glycine max]KRH47839.1 hypothetical protein GLYMA_07G052000v4 [Glycine max]